MNNYSKLGTKGLACGEAITGIDTFSGQTNKITHTIKYSIKLTVVRNKHKIKP